MESVIDLEVLPDKDSRSGGIWLTWKELCVTVPNDGSAALGSEPLPIVKGLTGYAEPGEVLAVMGPSGCGKSTLLDALAGRLGSNMRHSGQILLNGRKHVLAFGTSAYVAQDDKLMATLTVREAIHYSALLQLPESMLKSEKLATAEMAIKKMGLQDCSNNLIGGRTIRGISGGQKRRVSICMEILTRPQLLFLDEPTSGLDSAASYHVMSYLINLAKQEGITVIASLHQPSSEVFELFHKLCLLSYGLLVYFGPAPAAYTFFSVNGFPCPTMRNPSDHYLKTINNDFELGLEGKLSTENNINILVQSYKSSEAHRQVQKRVSIICEHEGVKLEKGSQASFITQSLLLTKRSFVNMYRDPGYYRLRLAIYVVICLCLGILFHGLDDSYGSIQARISMLVYIGGFLTFMAIGGFPSFVEDMKIFERERLNGHYGVGVYVISNTLSSIPYLLILSIVPGAITYYLSGLQKGFDHFICFVLLLFASMTMVESLMMIVASIVPDFLMGIITGSGIQGLMMLTSGYFRLPNDLPKLFWKYPMYYISFGTYVNQGFYKNEFEDLVFYNNDTRHTPGAKHMITGEGILSNTLQVQDSSKWVDVAILLGMVVLYRLIFFGIIKVAEIRQKLSHTTKSA